MALTQKFVNFFGLFVLNDLSHCGFGTYEAYYDFSLKKIYCFFQLFKKNKFTEKIQHCHIVSMFIEMSFSPALDFAG